MKRSAIRVIVLGLISFNLYNFYWFYVTRKQLNEELGETASLRGYTPLLQVFGPMIIFWLGVPVSIVLIFLIIGIVLLPLVILAALVLSVMTWYYLIKDVSRVRTKAGLSEIQPGLYVLGYIVLNMVVSSAGVGILGLLASNMNEYWDKKTRGKATEAPYTTGEVLVSAAGAALLLLILTAFILLLIFGESLE